MESAQQTVGFSPSPNTTNNRPAPPRNTSTHFTQRQQSASQPLRRRRISARPSPPDPGDVTYLSEGSDRDRGSDVEELGRFSPTPPSNAPRQQRPRPRRPPSLNRRPEQAPSMPLVDGQLTEPVPRRPAISVRRSAPRRIPRLGEPGPASAASDTDTTSSSSSSGPPPIRRRQIRTRTEMDLSLRGPILEKSEEGTIVPPGVEFRPDYNGHRRLPARTRNPRDILNDGERGFIVDLKMNLEVEIQLKAAIMGDLTISVL